MAGERSMADVLNRVRVWDLPTRLFHWGLALLVLAAVLSAKLGAMDWHLRCGYGVLTLLAFRLVWGVVGGYWSRWWRLCWHPGAAWRYLRGRPLPGDHFEIGHNPLGAVSVLLMLAWMSVQVGSGLVSDDEIATSGPLARFVSSEQSQDWTAYHHGLGQWGLYLLLGLHLAAVVYHQRIKRHDLIRPMVSGDKFLPATVPASRDGAATRLLALALLALCVAGVYGLLRLADAA